MKTTHWLATIVLGCAPVVGRATLEFSAYLETPKETRFVITDGAVKTSSGWITLGQSFGGHTLVAFDRKNEVVAMKKGEVTIELRLKEARVKEGRDPAAERAARIAAAKAELAELRKKFTDLHPRVREQLSAIAALEAAQQK